MPGCGCGTSYKAPAKKPAPKKTVAKKQPAKPKPRATAHTVGGGCCCRSSYEPKKKIPSKPRSSCHRRCDDYSDSSSSCSCSDCWSDGYDSTDSYTDDSYSSDERCHRRSRGGCGC